MSFLLAQFFSTNSLTEENENINNLDKVEILCDRIKSTTSMYEKRQSLIELKVLTKNFKLEVGTRALDLLIKLIENNSEDFEIAINSLELILEIVKSEDSNDSTDIKNKGLSNQFSEILLKNSENVKIFLNITESSDYQIRWFILKIFNALAHNQLEKLQSNFTKIHYAYSRILEYLNESREIIRNDCIILLLKLTLNDENSKKLLVFENLYEKLFRIIFNDFNDNIVINDCILVICNVLNNNLSTQKSFVEFNHFSQVEMLFINLIEDPILFKSSENCLISILNLIRIFVNPINPVDASKNRRIIGNTSLLKVFFDLAFRKEASERLSVETVITLSDLINCDPINREIFSNNINSIFQSEPLPQILIIINDPKKSISYRKSLLYLFKSYVIKNLKLSEHLNSLFNQKNSKLYDAFNQGFLDHGSFSSLITSVTLIILILNFPSIRKKIYDLILPTQNERCEYSIVEKCFSILQLSKLSESSQYNFLCLLLFLINDYDDGIKELMRIPDVFSFLINGIKTSYSSDSLQPGLFSLIVAVVYKKYYLLSDNKLNFNSMVSIKELLDFINVISKRYGEYISFNPTNNNLSSFICISSELSVISKKLEVFLLDLQDHSKFPVESVTCQDIKKSNEEVSVLKNEILTYKKLYIKYKLRYIDINRTYIMLKNDFACLEEDFTTIMHQYSNTLKICTRQDEFIKKLEKYKEYSENFEPSAPIEINELPFDFKIILDNNSDSMNKSIILSDPEIKDFNENENKE